jgi:hypothetical protein
MASYHLNPKVIFSNPFVVYFKAGSLTALIELYVRITENRRLAIAAAAMVQRMINRRSPLVFLPVLPLNKGSPIAPAIVVVKERLSVWEMSTKGMLMCLELRVPMCLRLLRISQPYPLELGSGLAGE